MNENVQEALIILVIGMITVFVILSLVVITGQILIRLTNRFAPPQVVKESAVASAPLVGTAISNFDKAVISKNKLAAIIGTVEHLTKGKGSVQKIEKL